MPCRQAIRRVDQVAPHRTYYGGSENPSLTPWLGRKCDSEERLRRKEGSSLTYFALLGRICKSSPGIAPSDKFPSIASPLAPTSSEKPRLNRLRKCSQNHPACLTCHPERSNSSRCALTQSLTLPISFAFYPSPSLSISDWYRGLS